MPHKPFPPQVALVLVLAIITLRQCVYTYIYVACVQMHAHVWVHMNMEDRGVHTFTLFFETRSVIEPRTHRLVKLDG